MHEPCADIFKDMSKISSCKVKLFYIRSLRVRFPLYPVICQMKCLNTSRCFSIIKTDLETNPTSRYSGGINNKKNPRHDKKCNFFNLEFVMIFPSYLCSDWDWLIRLIKGVSWDSKERVGGLSQTKPQATTVYLFTKYLLARKWHPTVFQLLWIRRCHN